MNKFLGFTLIVVLLAGCSQTSQTAIPEADSIEVPASTPISTPSLGDELTQVINLVKNDYRVPPGEVQLDFFYQTSDFASGTVTNETTATPVFLYWYAYKQDLNWVVAGMYKSDEIDCPLLEKLEFPELARVGCM